MLGGELNAAECAVLSLIQQCGRRQGYCFSGKMVWELLPLDESKYKTSWPWIRNSSQVEVISERSHARKRTKSKLIHTGDRRAGAA